VIVTEAPTAPEVGDRLVMVRAAKENADETMHTMRRETSRLLNLMIESSFLAIYLHDVGFG